MRIGLIEGKESVARSIAGLAATTIGEHLRFLGNESDLQRPWGNEEDGPGPDLLLLGLDEQPTNALAGAAAVRAWSPRCVIVAYGADIPGAIRLRAIDVGARLIVRYPFDGSDLAGALALAAARTPVVQRALPPANAVEEISFFDNTDDILAGGAPRMPLRAAAPALDPRPLGAASVVTVFGVKGGVGASVLAVNLACALSSLDRRVCLIDGNICFGSCGALLNIPINAPSMLDLVEGDLSPSRISAALVGHETGLSVLLAPPSPDDASRISSAFLRAVVRVLRGQFDVLIIDTATSYDERDITLLRAADRIVVACSPEYPAMRCMQGFLSTVLGRLTYPRERLLPVLIRANTMSRASQTEAESSLALPFLWRIVSDGPRIKRSVDAGEPVIVHEPDAAVSRDMWALALFLAGREEIPRRGGLCGRLAAARRRQASAAARAATRRRIFIGDDDE